MERQSKGATKRFARRLFFVFVITVMLIGGAIVIAYSKGSERGVQLYKQEQENALVSAYNKGYQDAVLPTIESGEISGFALEGKTFVVFITYNGETHRYECEAGNVVEALPFQ